MKNIKKSYILIIAAVFIWSLSGLLIKTVKADSLWINFIRSLCGGVFLLPYAFKEKISPLKNIFLAGILMAIFLLSLTITTRLSTAAMGISMQYTAPIYAITYNCIKNKKFTLYKIWVLILISLGIFLNVISNLKSPLAIFTGIIVGLAFVIYSYLLQGTKNGNPLGIISLVNIVAALFYAVILIFHRPSFPNSIEEIITIGISGIFISGISYAFYSESLRSINIERVLIICLMEPILNPIWVYLGKGEVPNLLTVVALIFILLGALLDIIYSKK